MADRVREPFWNVPNTLTMGRLVLAFVVFGLIARPITCRPWWSSAWRR